MKNSLIIIPKTHDGLQVLDQAGARHSQIEHTAQNLPENIWSAELNDTAQTFLHLKGYRVDKILESTTPAEAAQKLFDLLAHQEYQKQVDSLVQSLIKKFSTNNLSVAIRPKLKNQIFK